MDKIFAIIPARSGSKSLVDKNIKLLSGHPLLAYSIAAAKMSKKIDRVIVSTDSNEYAKVAQQYGAEVPFLRPKKYSMDSSSDKGFLLHAIKWFQENENFSPEYWVHLRPTTPLREVKVIDNAIDIILNDDTATSLRSGHKAPESPLKWFTKSGKYFKGFLNNEDYNLPKESFQDVYIPDGFIDIIKTSFLVNQKELHGDMMIGFESPVCTEVDSLNEFLYIQYQLDGHGSNLLNYLNNNKN
jgi:N-acylneuraminate cytidylyltransferase